MTVAQEHIWTEHVDFLTFSKDLLDFDWLDAVDSETEIGPLRHISLNKPLKVVLDSRDSEAIILR